MKMTLLLRVLFVLVCLLGITAIPVFAQTPAVATDKLAWDMRQAPEGLTFAVLIDGQRQTLSGATCGPLSNGVSVCQAPIPAMTVGTHSVQVVAILTAGTATVESAPSVALSVSFVVVVTPENVRVVKG
jgi:hypothetical protein